MKKVFAFVFLVLFISSLALQAQNSWEFGGFAGPAFYSGDINPKFSFRSPGFAFGAHLRRNFDGRICMKAGVSYAQVQASDANSDNIFQQTRNLSFRSPIYEGHLSGEFNFVSYHGGRGSQPFSPFLTLGLGLSHFNPQAKYDGQWHDLQPLGTEGQASGESYALVHPFILLGGGFKADLNPNWSLNIEISGRMLSSDYLDDISGDYADYRLVEGYHGSVAGALSDRSIEISDTRIGLEGHQRGNSKNKDSYLIMEVGLTYYIQRLTCPAFGN